MGGQQSDLQQSRMTIPKVGTLRKISQSYDLRYGEIKVLETNTDIKLAVRYHAFQDESQWLSFKSQADRVMAMGENFVIKLLDVQHVTEKELCTQMTTAHALYEYYLLDLSTEHNDIQISGRGFREIEILAMIYSLLTALISLKNNHHRSHGDIRLETVQLTSMSLNNIKRGNLALNPVYKITDIQYLTEYNAFRRCVAKMKGNYNLSPEQLIFLKEKIMKPTYDVYRSDVFSVGLLALQMATVNRLEDIYDYNNYHIIPETLDKYINTMRQNYQEPLCQLICTYLQLAPENRPDLDQAHSLLAQFQSDLENYFKNSTLQSTITNYACTFQQSQSFKSQIKEQIHIQPIDAQETLESLDQRAREALKRSQEAQLRYQRSPLKQLKNDHLFEPTTNYLSYSKLQPILISELKPNSQKQSSYYNYNYNNQQRDLEPERFNDNIQQYKHFDDDAEQYHQELRSQQQPAAKESVVEQFDPTNSNRQSRLEGTSQFSNHYMNQAQSIHYAQPVQQKVYPQQPQIEQSLQYYEQSGKQNFAEVANHQSFSQQQQQQQSQQHSQQQISQHLLKQSFNQMGNQDKFSDPQLKSIKDESIVDSYNYNDPQQMQQYAAQFQQSQQIQQSQPRGSANLGQSRTQWKPSTPDQIVTRTSHLQDNSPKLTNTNIFPNQLPQIIDRHEEADPYLTGSSVSSKQGSVPHSQNQSMARQLKVPPSTNSQRTNKPNMSSTTKQSVTKQSQSKISTKSVRK